MSESPPPPKPRAWRGASANYAAQSDLPVRRRKAVLVLFVLLAVAGAFAAFLLYPRNPPRPSFVAIVIDQYRETDANGDPRFPASAWAARDREALETLGWDGHAAFTSQERRLLVQELRDLGRGQPAGQPLVVYLCAYAAVTGEGVPALLPADARLDDESTWLPVREVLESLKTCPVKHKLLLLDLMKPLTDARVGLLRGEVGAPLEQLVQAAVEGDPGLQVLCACAPGQTSHASEELGHTVFAHYLTEGLAGRADGQLEGQKADGLVSVRELAAFVIPRVNRWAWRNRAAWQTPVLYGDGPDYALTLAGKDPPAEPAALPRDYPAFLSKGWELCDRWRKDPSGTTTPDLVRQLQATVLRGEEWWRSGETAGRVEEFVQSRVKRLEQARAARSVASDRGPSRSLAEEEGRGFKPPREGLSEARRQLKELARLYARSRAPKAAEKDAAPYEAAAEEFKKKYQDKPTELAWTVFHAAAEEDAPTQQRLACWNGLLDPPPEFAEIAFLRRLAGREVTKPEDWPAEAAALALRVAGAAEKAAAAEDDSLRAWVADLDTEAARERRAGEGQLFSAAPASQAQAAATLDRAQQAYARLNHALDTLRGARQARDDGLAALPGFASYLEKAPDKEAAWGAAVRDTRTVRDLLARPPEAGVAEEAVRQVGERATALRDALATLRQPLEGARLRRLIDRSPRPVAADLLEMDALLGLPEVNARDRLTLWNAYRTAAAVLSEEPSSPEAAGPALFDANQAGQRELKLGLLRARVSSALLQLAGAAGAERVAAAVREVEKAPQNPAAWLALRKDLRRAWSDLEAERRRAAAR